MSRTESGPEVITSHVHSCWRCGKDFDVRFPGTSVTGKGPAHAACIAAEVESLRAEGERLRAAIQEAIEWLATSCDVQDGNALRERLRLQEVLHGRR